MGYRGRRNEVYPETLVDQCGVDDLWERGVNLVRGGEGNLDMDPGGGGRRGRRRKGEEGRWMTWGTREWDRGVELLC